jgi:toxin ParE1/3/4
VLYNLKVSTLATVEILETFDWYETRKVGLGLDFLNELEYIFLQVQKNPKTFSFYEKPVRQAHLSRFPYQVVYEILEAEIIVYSVFMAMKNPTAKRLK